MFYIVCYIVQYILYYVPYAMLYILHQNHDQMLYYMSGIFLYEYLYYILNTMCVMLYAILQIILYIT